MTINSLRGIPTILALIFLSGCSAGQRYHEALGGFSYVVPIQWERGEALVSELPYATLLNQQTPAQIVFHHLFYRESAESVNDHDNLVAFYKNALFEPLPNLDDEPSPAFF